MARKYARDNRGRFASKGAGATARGGRLKTAGGIKREGQTIKAAGGPAGTVGKPRGLQPGAISGKIKPAAAQSRATQLRQRADRLEAKGNSLMGVGRRGDTAMTNMSLSSRARTSELNQGIKGLGMSRQAQALRSKADRIEQRAAQSSAKALNAAAKPKRTRTAESQRISRAKQVEKRRGMNISNPAAWRQESAGRMAANAARTQQQALAFYKGGGKAKPASKAGAKAMPIGAASRKGSSPDLSQAAFERRAKLTEKRARAAEKAVAGADRGFASPSTRRAFRTADALRSAADSYSSLARRAKTGEFSAAQLFSNRRRSTTAPKLSRSEKTAATRRANAAKRTQNNIRRMEQARRWA